VVIDTLQVAVILALPRLRAHTHIHTHKYTTHTHTSIHTHTQIHTRIHAVIDTLRVAVILALPRLHTYTQIHNRNSYMHICCSLLDITWSQSFLTLLLLYADTRADTHTNIKTCMFAAVCGISRGLSHFSLYYYYVQTHILT
jgi:hypothetical protein